MVDTAEQSAGTGTEGLPRRFASRGPFTVASPCGGHAHSHDLAATMIVVRATAKLRAVLGAQAQAQDRVDPGRSDSDWYANLLHIQRRKCLLVTHAGTLFSVFSPDVRAGQLRPFGPFLVARIAAELDAEGLPGNALGELDGDRVTITGTAGGRSVVGCMTDLALTCRLAVEHAGGLAWLDLDALHHVLHRHIYAARDYVPAVDLIPGSPPSQP
ncbi:MAG: DUF6933 domain-containing protein [Solirubrobacteraceae bacterium]